MLEGDLVNLGVTSPAAALALGLMYLQTNDAAVAAAFQMPGQSATKLTNEGVQLTAHIDYVDALSLLPSLSNAVTPASLIACRYAFCSGLCAT